MKCSLKPKLPPKVVESPITKRRVLEVGLEIKIKMPTTKILEYRQISISTGVFQYLVDFLNGQNQSKNTMNTIYLTLQKRTVNDWCVKTGIPIQCLDDDNHHIELGIDRYDSIYANDFVEINGDPHVCVGVYLHITKHIIVSTFPMPSSKTIDPATNFINVGDVYQYLFNTLEFEITGQMRFKKISEHEAKVVLINPEKLKWKCHDQAHEYDFEQRMNDPFVNKLH